MGNWWIDQKRCNEEQTRKNCVQEEVQNGPEDLQEKRPPQMDQSFHASAKKPRTHRVRCLQKRKQILQGSYAYLQEVKNFQKLLKRPATAAYFTLNCLMQLVFLKTSIQCSI